MLKRLMGAESLRALIISIVTFSLAAGCEIRVRSSSFSDEEVAEGDDSGDVGAGDDDEEDEVVVPPVNVAPVANDETYWAAVGSNANTISVLANDTDADDDDLTIDSFTQPASGTVTDNGDGTLSYTPNAAFRGTDSFTYTIDDGNGDQSTATVNLRTVTPFTWTNATGNNLASDAGNYCGTINTATGVCNGDTALNADATIYLNDACGSDCDMSLASAITVGGFHIESSYTATVTQSSGAHLSLNATAATGGPTHGFSMASGHFVGHSAGQIVMSDAGVRFSITGGTMDAPGMISIFTHFNVTGGTFNHNNGTVRLYEHCACAGELQSIDDLYNVTLEKARSSDVLVMGTVHVQGTLTLAAFNMTGTGSSIDGGTIVVHSRVTASGIQRGGTATIQLVDGASLIGVDTCLLPNLSIGNGGAYIDSEFYVGDVDNGGGDVSVDSPDDDMAILDSGTLYMLGSLRVGSISGGSTKFHMIGYTPSITSTASSVFPGSSLNISTDRDVLMESAFDFGSADVQVERGNWDLNGYNVTGVNQLTFDADGNITLNGARITYGRCTGVPCSGL